MITVRPAVREDAPAIGAVFDAAVRAGWTYLGDLVAEPMFTAEDWEQLVADHLPPNVLLVAVDETDGVIGYTAVHPGDGEMFLLFVHPACAGRGIGRILLAAAHDALRAAGCQQAYLYTHERNEPALALYASAGYRPRRSRPRIGFWRHHHPRAALGQTALTLPAHQAHRASGRPERSDGPEESLRGLRRSGPGGRHLETSALSRLGRPHAH